MLLRQGILLAAALALAQGASAVQFEDKPYSYHTTENGTVVISIGDTSYSLYDVPASAPLLEITTDQTKQAEIKAELKFGELVSFDEAQTILKYYYTETAFDSQSIRLRNLKIYGHRYATWCGTDTLFFLCGLWRAAAGTLVSYEVNGTNRSGGMVGYGERWHMLRKFASKPTIAPEPPSSSPAPQ